MHSEATRLIHDAMKEFYLKQGQDITEELDFALLNLAEFVARAVIRVKHLEVSA